MRDAVTYFHSLIERDPASAARQYAELLDRLVARNVCFDARPMPIHLRPHFLSRTRRQTLETVAHDVLRAALKAEAGAFGGDREKLYDWLGISDAERDLLRIHPGYEEPVVWTRLDAFLGAADDDIRFLEFNHDAPAGIGYSAVMAELFLDLPLMAEFQKSYAVVADDGRPQLLHALLEAYRRFGGKEHPQIAIVDWTGVRTSSDFEILQRFFVDNGHATTIADPREVELRDGKLFAGDFRIDLVYRRVVTSELLEKLDETKDFVAAYRAHAACFVNTFRCRTSENKAFLEILSDPAHLGHLTAEERAVLDRHIPWTRSVAPGATDHHGTTVDLGDFLRTNRDRFVLKPADSYGGRNVTLGAETDQSVWETALNFALGEPGWVVQERVPTPIEVFPVRVGDGFEFREMKYNINPFSLGGKMRGAVVRTSDDAVINVSSGGGSIPTFIVEER